MSARAFVSAIIGTILIWAMILAAIFCITHQSQAQQRNNNTCSMNANDSQLGVQAPCPYPPCTVNSPPGSGSITLNLVLPTGAKGAIYATPGTAWPGSLQTCYGSVDLNLPSGLIVLYDNTPDQILCCVNGVCQINLTITYQPAYIWSLTVQGVTEDPAAPSECGYCLTQAIELIR